MNKDLMIVYIIGAGRSGSTIFDMSLGGHSEIFSLGEIVHLPKYLKSNSLCACGNPVNKCEIWKDVVAKLTCINGVENLSEHTDEIKVDLSAEQGIFRTIKSKIKFALALLFNRSFISKIGLSFADISQKPDPVFDFYRAVQQVTNCGILVDSSKSVGRAFRLCYERPDVPYRIVHLVRDGRGYLHSIMKKSYISRIPRVVNGVISTKATKFPAPKKRNAIRGCMGWVKTNLLANLAIRRLPQRYCVRLRYEDFCEAPEKELNRLCDFLGIDYQENMIDFRNIPHHNIGGNHSRWSKDNIKKPSLAWKKDLSNHNLKVFKFIGGWLNKYYGY